MFEGVNATYSRRSSESVETACALTSSDTFRALPVETIAIILQETITLGGLRGQGYLAKCFRPTGATSAVALRLDCDIVKHVERWQYREVFEKHYVHARVPRQYINYIVWSSGQMNMWYEIMFVTSWFIIARFCSVLQRWSDSCVAVASLSLQDKCHKGHHKSALPLQFCNVVRCVAVHCTELPNVVCRPTSVPLGSFTTSSYVTSSSLLSVLRFYRDCLFPSPLTIVLRQDGQVHYGVEEFSVNFHKSRYIHDHCPVLCTQLLPTLHLDWPVGGETWRSKTLADLINWLKRPGVLLWRRRKLSKHTTINGQWKNWGTSYRTILTHLDRSLLLCVVASWEY